MKAKLVFEKFTEDSDPVVDMGIGLRYVYDNLKDGDVLMLKKELIVEGNFNGQTEEEEFYAKGTILEIKSIEDLPSNNKEIRYEPYDNIVDYYNNERSLKLVGFDNWAFDFNFFKKYFTVINPK